MENTNNRWELASGTWEMSDQGFELVTSSTGNKRAAELQALDIARLFNTPRDADNSELRFPPEFLYSPLTGKKLSTEHDASVASWVAPFGETMPDAGVVPDTRGLRQTSNTLELANVHERNADDVADVSMPIPDSGDFQFLTGRFGTRAPALVALDAAQGRIYAYLPASNKWLPVRGPGKTSMDGSRITPSSWRAEAADSDEAGNTIVFAPSDSGLSTLRVDVTALSYEVSYVGNAPVVGAPIAHENIVWAVTSDAAGKHTFVGVDLQGKAVKPVELANKVIPGTIGMPVARGRSMIWICSNGLLRLQRQANGNFDGVFSPWPDNVDPETVFGSPYLSGAGALWQLCFDSERGGYAYVRIDSNGFESVDVSAPRACSGKAHFRFTSQPATPPWEEPEHGDDSATTQFIVPLLESLESRSVIALRLQAESGVADVLHSKHRCSFELCLVAPSGDVSLYTSKLPEPWLMRLFVYEGHLWAYHPGMRNIEGWCLA